MDDAYRDFYAAVERVHEDLRQRGRALRRSGTWDDASVATGYEGAAALLARVLVDFGPGRLRGD